MKRGKADASSFGNSPSLDDASRNRPGGLQDVSHEHERHISCFSFTDKKLVMRTYLAFFVLACTATAFTAQPTPPSKGQASANPNASKALTLSGCVVKDEAGDQLALVDLKNARYHLSGSHLEHYVGQPVQVTGFRIGGLHIVGGLWPSPNVAAQAGDIDPVRAAIAALPGGESHGTGPEPVVEFQVKKVHALKGGCP